MTAQPASIGIFPKSITKDTKMVNEIFICCILTCHTKNVYKTLSLGLSKMDK